MPFTSVEMRYPQFLTPFLPPAPHNRPSHVPRSPSVCSAPRCSALRLPFVRRADSKFTSFQRQLNLYQFKRRKGAHAGAFHHPSFRRGQRHLLSKVRRQKVKRDLAVEARAAQRLARAKGGGGTDGSQHGGLSGRGRTRGAAQADLRPIRRHRQIEDGDDVYASDEDDEFALEPGSRGSALRRRVDEGPATRGGGGMGVRYTQDSHDDESSNDDTWHSENNSSGLDQFSSGDDEDRLNWGGGYGNNGNWRQQVPGTPERSSRELHHVSTPMTMTPQSEYGQSPSSSNGFDRTSSVGSSMASSLSFTSSPTHSELMFEQSSSPYQFNDYDESGHSDSTNEHSPMSVHSPSAATTVHDAAAAAAAGAHVSPAQQRQRDHDLSLAAVVDATISGWSSPHPSSSLPHLEQFGWGAANVSSPEAGMPWSDPPAPAPVSSGVPVHHQSSQGSPTQEDFGFIDLFATNWDSVAEGTSSSSSSAAADSAGMLSSSSGGGGSGGGGGGGGGGGRDVSANDMFLKEAQAAGVFGGVEDFLNPALRSGGGAAGGYGGSAEYA